MKRVPLRRRVQRIVSLVAIIALLGSSIVGLISMLQIRDMSKKALQYQLEINLSNSIVDKASLADVQFSKYSDYIIGFASQIHDMYCHPDHYVGMEVQPPSARNQNRLAMQRYLRDESVTAEDVAEELALFGNLEPVWNNAAMLNTNIITTIYLGTESGLLISYDKDSAMGVEEGSDESHFDFSGREWYTKAREKGKVGFTDIYMDDYGRGMMVSCYAPFFNANGQFAGAVSMDMLITDIYKRIVAMDLGEGGNVYLIDQAGYTVDPADSNGLKKVSELVSDADVNKALEKKEHGFSVSKDDIYYIYSPVESTGWMLCIEIPESVVLSSVYEMDASIRKALLLFGVVLVALGAFVACISHRFAKSLTEPMVALEEDAKIISGGNLEHRASVRRNDEIGDLANSFNDMAASLKQYITDLTHMTAEKERIGAELNVATQIQEDMLPRIFPAFPNRTDIDIFASMDPAKEVGGDFYDFFLVDEDHLCMVMADVSGKGIPAALFMVIAKALIKNQALLGLSPSEILYNVNNQLCDGNEVEMFVTVWLAVVELSTGKGKAANAGHEHPCLRRKDGEYELVEYRHSPAVAVMEGMKFREHDFELHPGDRLFVYTDGVPEATSAEKELFGTARMLEAMNANPDAKPAEVLKNVRRAVDGFVKEAEQFDDLTMLCLQYNGPEGAAPADPAAQ